MAVSIYGGILGSTRFIQGYPDGSKVGIKKIPLEFKGSIKSRL